MTQCRATQLLADGNESTPSQGVSEGLCSNCSFLQSTAYPLHQHPVGGGGGEYHLPGLPVPLLGLYGAMTTRSLCPYPLRNIRNNSELAPDMVVNLSKPYQVSISRLLIKFCEN